MLQSEYDAIVRQKRLKVLLIILTSIMVSLVLYVVVKIGREYPYQPTETLTESTNPYEVKIPDDDIIIQYREFRGEDAEEFLRGDSLEAQYLRSVKDLKL